jgi:hypothetical protein
MKCNLKLLLGCVLTVSLMLTFGCGGGGVSLSDLPLFPGATELKAGDSNLGNTLKNNMETDKKMRDAMGPLAAKGSTEQKGFSLPAGSTWNDVKAFYDKELAAMGWKSGLGGAAGKFVDVNKVMNAGGSSLSKQVIYSKGGQTLTIIMMTSGKKQLILSLSTV